MVTAYVMQRRARAREEVVRKLELVRSRVCLCVGVRVREQNVVRMCACVLVCVYVS